MTAPALFLCAQPRGAHWRLGDGVDPRRLTLIGWRSGGVDAGVPEPVARVLAATLTSLAQVSFFCAGAVPADAEVQVQPIGFRGYAERVVALAQGFPRHAALVSTRAPAAAQRLFRATGFPWQLQGQIALLSQPGAALSVPAFERVRALFEGDWCEAVRGWSEQGVFGALRPGVDGDVAALFAVSDDFAGSFRSALPEQAAREGIPVEHCAEADFARRLADGGPGSRDIPMQ